MELPISNTLPQSSIYKNDPNIIPLLKLSDIKKEVDIIPNEQKTHGSTTITHFNVETNGIIYLYMGFDSSIIPQKLHMPELLLNSIFARIDTQKYSYDDLFTEFNLNYCSLSTSLGANYNFKNLDYFNPLFSVSIKFLAEKQHSVLKMLNDVFNKSIFANKEHLKYLVEENYISSKSYIEHLNSNLVSLKLDSIYSKYEKYNYAGTFPFCRYIKDIYDNFDERYETLVDDLNNITHMLMNKNHLIICVTCNNELYNKFESELLSFTDNLSDKIYPAQNYVFEKSILREAFSKSQDKLLCIGKGANYRKFGYNYKGSMDVLNSILSNEYFWKKIREKGGAYGFYSSFAMDGSVSFVSYDDPNLKNTLSVFDNTSKFIRSCNLSEREINKYIIGVIGSFETTDTPSVKAGKGIYRLLRNITDEDRQRNRNEILSTTLADIKNLANLVDECMRQDNICVCGNKDIIEKNADLFDLITDSATLM